VAWRIYGGNRGVAGGEGWATRFPRIHRILVNKYYVDELYDATVVRPLIWIARACWKFVDGILVEGAVHAGPFLARLTGDLGRFTTTGNVRNYALYFLVGVLFFFWWIFF
jgi:NADH-quinone oxidoreductase subunit L